MWCVEWVCRGFCAHFRVAFRCYLGLSFSLLVWHGVERMMGSSVRLAGVHFPETVLTVV